MNVSDCSKFSETVRIATDKLMVVVACKHDKEACQIPIICLTITYAQEYVCSNFRPSYF